MIDRALRRIPGSAERVARKRPFSSFHPVWPVASRQSLRRKESGGIG